MFKKLHILYHQRRALNCFGSSDFDQAVYHFRKIYERAPATRGIRHNLALALMARGDYADAEQLFLAEIEDFGEYYPRLRALADLYYTWGRRSEALRYYSLCLESSDAGTTGFLQTRQHICGNDDAWENSRKSMDLYRQGIEAEARNGDGLAISIELYRQAVELDPSNMSALNNWGAVLMNKFQKPDEALELFEKALELDQPGLIRLNRQRALEALQEARR